MQWFSKHVLQCTWRVQYLCSMSLLSTAALVLQPRARRSARVASGAGGGGGRRDRAAPMRRLWVRMRVAASRARGARAPECRREPGLPGGHRGGPEEDFVRSRWPHPRQALIYCAMLVQMLFNLLFLKLELYSYWSRKMMLNSIIQIINWLFLVFRELWINCLWRVWLSLFSRSFRFFVQAFKVSTYVYSMIGIYSPPWNQ